MSDSPSDFTQLGLIAELLQAVEQLGFTEPTPIQARAIPLALQGRDLIGRARTGSGKTLAFALPLVQRLVMPAKQPQALVITPTRELALQVTAMLTPLTESRGVNIVTVYGGVPYPPQLQAIKRGVGVVVGTPGRLIDLLRRGDLDLTQVHIVTLDEADEMLRMGFIDDVKRLLGYVRKRRQVLLFSATMPKEIRAIAENYLRDPVEVYVEEEALTVHHIEQRWMRVPAAHKLETLHVLLSDQKQGMVLVFANTRVGVAEVADALISRGLTVDRLHGAMPQNLRNLVLDKVRSGESSVLVATDVAARGIDVQHIELVVNYDIPEVAERYVHRIGRTARAGRTGMAISLVTPKRKRRLREIARALDIEITEVEVPTRSALLAGQRKALRAEVTQAAQGDMNHAAAQVQQLTTQGLSATQIAAAAVHLLAQARRLPLDPALDGVQPDWVRPVSTFSTHTASADIDQVSLTVHAGKQAGLVAKELVAVLAKVGVEAKDIGRIRLRGQHTTVGLSRKHLDTLLAEHQTLELLGQVVRIEAAEPVTR
ncbi:MAG: ATP-dependent RNA helicase DeaD [Kiritimatiellia bacterium]